MPSAKRNNLIERRPARHNHQQPVHPQGDPAGGRHAPNRLDKVSIDDANKLSTKANNHQKAVDSMVDSALQMMADEAHSEGKRPKKR